MQNPFANSLQTSNAPSINPIKPKPVNHSYSQNAPFDKWKQDTDLALSWGCKESYIFQPAFTSIKDHKILVWIGSNRCNFRDVGTSGRRRGWGRRIEIKQWAKRNEKGSPHPPQPQASSNPLLNKEGSAICDWFLELFSERRVSPCQDSTTCIHFRNFDLTKSHINAFWCSIVWHNVDLNTL